MNIHKNARTTPYSRAEIVRREMVLRETPRAVATALGVSERTAANLRPAPQLRPRPNLGSLALDLRIRDSRTTRRPAAQI